MASLAGSKPHTYIVPSVYMREPDTTSSARSWILQVMPGISLEEVFSGAMDIEVYDEKWYVNYHTRIRFSDDGPVWLVRVLRINGSIPQSPIDYLVCSEYATLKFLEMTKVPATANDKENAVGVSYILMEEIAGKPWSYQRPRGKRFADNQDKERLWNGLAGILIVLQHHPFNKAGSLLPGPSPSRPMVSALASERFLVLSPSGPFNTAGDYHASFLEQNLALIADGQLFTDFPVNAYLLFLFLEADAQDLATKPDHATEETAGQFYIKHVDDKGDHLMVDDALNFTGIIDWQVARVVPASEAFGPSLVTANMAYIYDGVSFLTIHDHALVRFLKAKGAADLAGLMTKDEKPRKSSSLALMLTFRGTRRCSGT